MPAFGQRNDQIGKGRVLCALLVILAALAFLPNLARAQGTCAPISAPEAFLEFNHMDPMLDRHRSVRWLNSRAGGSPRFLVTGLTEYEVQASFDMRFEPRQVGFGRYCLDPVRVNPKVDVVKHLVYIASELERGTCEYDVVYAHEGEHVKINQGMEADIRAALDDLVNDVVRQVGAMFPMPADNAQRAMRRLISEYGRDFKRRLNDIRRRSAEKHKRIDTPREYEKLSLACGPNSAFQTVLQDAAR
ncbi:hypothetical protein [Thalassospira sp. ER-Se-21-Dark]|uniref:hypothetical protein n=1 Tax=Thalassospira sp. ER-Se-21-Dark TaxID=2585190 RepID=UPI001B316C14|nr:hypothetical protein [Thalassospira sp. ER-Se-21-Dark]MBP3125081.1 hypothetical protein [Thalassospira sp. ER-Se-21-Dark]